MQRQLEYLQSKLQPSAHQQPFHSSGQFDSNAMLSQGQGGHFVPAQQGYLPPHAPPADQFGQTFAGQGLPHGFPTRPLPPPQFTNIGGVPFSGTGHHQHGHGFLGSPVSSLSSTASPPQRFSQGAMAAYHSS